MRKLVVQTKCLDPWRNLAVEEALLSMIPEFPRILFLWRSRDAVVIGKNQNPWRECPVCRLKQAGVVLARRISGGGAVFQDEGNLNFAFLMPRRDYDVHKQFSTVIAALAGLGIGVRMSGRNSLAFEGLKVSGNAFCFRKESAMHHGTLLVSSDLARLQSSLGSCGGREFACKAISSCPAPVVNLSSINPCVDVATAAEAIIDAWKDGADAEEWSDDIIEAMDLAAIREKHESWAWRFGRTPPFRMTLNRECLLGDLGLVLEIAEGSIASSECLLDGVRCEAADKALQGSRLDHDEVRLRLSGCLGSEPAAELAAYIAGG